MSQTDSPTGTPEPQDGTERVRRELELVRVSEQIDDYVRRAEQNEVLRRWAYVFREEIDVVNRCRNSIVHAVEVSDKTLNEALRIGRRLVEVADKGLREAR
jgi:hypothetical protein